MGFRKVIIVFAFFILPITSIIFYIFQQKEVDLIAYFMTAMSCLLAIFFVLSKFKVATILGRLLVSIYAVNSLYKTILEQNFNFDLIIGLVLALVNIVIVSLIYYFFVEYSTSTNETQRASN
jgi:hypothetical protein